MFPQVFGKYVLDRELASGGMARVYLATLRGAVGFEKRLVVKQIRPELASDPAFVRRFVDEAKTAVELSHPNIVPVYELGVEQGVYYIAMEFCAGATLAELLSEAGAISPEEGAYLGVEICRALDYAHRRAGIVHRDVTPRNVLIDEEGAVRLIDFGIAAPVAEHGPQEIFGSPGHMPPEQLAGKKLTPATDVFAVATLLVEAWTKKPPFRRATARASAEALQEQRPRLEELIPELAPLAELIERGLSLDAEQRPAQAELFARPLRDFLRSADAGDVARRLGERVRKVHGRAGRRSSHGEGTAALPARGESSRASDAGISAPTYTFAARGEVAEWTRRLEDSAKGGSGSGGPSTRKLASIPPEEPASVEPVLDGVELSGESAPSSVPESAGPGRSPAPGEQRRARPVRLAGFALGAVFLASALVLLASSPRSAVTSARGARPVTAVLIPSTAPPTAPSAVVAEFREVRPPEPVEAPPRSVPPARSSQPSSTPKRASANDATPVASARLRLTADPPASVSLQGASGLRAFTTPVRELSVPPGVYVLTFRNDTYGMPVVARVNMEAGGERSVHVDFREVEPRVTVR
ncbi:MAG TPA: protein kinase [Polyangiaceae bacterium]|nr:protein kinase [Polyangiaceae bacterium]